MDWHYIDQFVQFKNNARVIGRQSAHVHEYGITFPDQSREHHFPSVVVAEEVVDTKSAVVIRRSIEIGHSGFQRAPGRNERLIDSPTEILEEFVWLYCGNREIRSGDHAHISDVAPVGRYCIKYLLAASPERKYS